MSENLGYLFYKQYYWRNNSIAIPSLQRIMNGSKDCKINLAINSKLVNSELQNFDHILSCLVQNKSFELTTIYPGLLVGSGYIHEAGFENEFKIGFHFDYTTGIPVIPGSSIKGMLRSVFPGKAKSNNDERKKYIKGLITEILKNTPANIDIESLENQIFDGIKQDGKRIPVYQRDIFFEAFPFESLNNDQKFLSDDYITHHADPLKDPNPVKFLKILPDVKFRFQFKLTDYDEKITSVVKEELFKKIILDLGVGAKTNVGYGYFVDRD